MIEDNLITLYKRTFNRFFFMFLCVCVCFVFCFASDPSHDTSRQQTNERHDDEKKRCLYTATEINLKLLLLFLFPFKHYEHQDHLYCARL